MVYFSLPISIRQTDFETPNLILIRQTQFWNAKLNFETPNSILKRQTWFWNAKLDLGEQYLKGAWGPLIYLSLTFDFRFNFSKYTLSTKEKNGSKKAFSDLVTGGPDEFDQQHAANSKTITKDVTFQKKVFRLKRHWYIQRDWPDA